MCGRWGRAWQETSLSLEGGEKLPVLKKLTSNGFSGWAFLVGQWLKIHLPMQKSWVQPLSWKDPLEKEVATLSSILAWVVPWTEEPGRVYEVTKICPWGHIRIGHELPAEQQQQQ